MNVDCEKQSVVQYKCSVERKALPFQMLFRDQRKSQFEKMIIEENHCFETQDRIQQTHLTADHRTTLVQCSEANAYLMLIDSK